MRACKSVGWTFFYHNMVPYYGYTGLIYCLGYDKHAYLQATPP